MLPLFDDDAWAELPQLTRRAIFAQDLARILDDVRAAAAGDGFDEPHAAVVYTLLDLDRQGHDEVAAILADALQRILAVKARTEERVSEGADVSISTEVALLHFKRPATGASPPAAGGQDLTSNL